MRKVLFEVKFKDGNVRNFELDEYNLTVYDVEIMSSQFRKMGAEMNIKEYKEVE